MADRSAHWEGVYGSKAFDTVSWYAPHLSTSLRLVETLCPSRSVAIVDVGGGESTLVDDLLEAGYGDLAVLDISAKAVAVSRERLGSSADRVDWYVGDVTSHDFGGRQFDLWHDRAVFHFLTDERDRAAYVDLLLRSVRPGGYAVMATFGPNGPLRCSGLDVVRCDEHELHRRLGNRFELLDSLLTDHVTPQGATQQFLYGWFRLRDVTATGA